MSSDKTVELLTRVQERVKYADANKASYLQSLEDQIAQFKLAREDLKDEILYVDGKVRNVRYLLADIDSIDEEELPPETMEQFRTLRAKLMEYSDSLEKSALDAALLIGLRL